ncbi:hypothetical protein PoB_003409500 [Plakobranchus ocellatus]|uniref:Secreted protein n=1 Tax=Plakobranchus ocellatus TaxID=259542 RepID=A0AAV4AL50_9GAST|nr:hypothetical protein PoB_003409500 [Plakobranchus ocellatus]
MKSTTTMMMMMMMMMIRFIISIKKISLLGPTYANVNATPPATSPSMVEEWLHYHLRPFPGLDTAEGDRQSKNSHRSSANEFMGERHAYYHYQHQDACITIKPAC